MGRDYRDYVIDRLLAGLRQQDPEAEILEIESLRDPDLLTRLIRESGVVLSVTIKFDVRVRVRAGDKQLWDLFGDAEFEAVDLDQPKSQCSFRFDIRDTRPAKWNISS